MLSQSRRCDAQAVTVVIAGCFKVIAWPVRNNNWEKRGMSGEGEGREGGE